ncbi:MAG: crotonase/enoyl-CoA hydratase family protein [Halieaceae bacterium]|nr:crotonase/enoyl-CoA hydratase family protein [Halieaceae bacterium]
MTQIVQIQLESDYSLITMDDAKANALSFEMLSQLNEALDKAEEAGKPVVICGRPGKFSAGFDLSVMGQGGDAMVDLLTRGSVLSRRLLKFDTPVIMAASGHALAMGALLLLSVDYRIGIHGEYKLGLNEVAIGMTLPWFGIELARARLADTHLQCATALAQVYDSTGAVAAGYLDEAVDADALLPRATALATQLSALDMTAHTNTKARVRADLNAALDAAVEREFGTAG